MNSCPICFTELTIDKLKADTMLVDHRFTVYSCDHCGYVVDFTLDEGSVRPLVIAAAYRRMMEDVQRLHSGQNVPSEKIQRYCRFFKSKELQEHVKVWEKQEPYFWTSTKHLTFWIAHD